MDYDYRNKAGSFRPNSQMNYGQTHYPRVGYPHPQSQPPDHGDPSRHPPFHHTSSPSSSTTSGIGIRVVLKPDCKITPPPQVAPLMNDVPRSNFQFDFDFERRILAETEKENPNWNKVVAEFQPPTLKPEPYPSSGSSANPIVSKYLSAGLSREAVPLAVANYGDNPTKVEEFCYGFSRLREMGFSANNIVDALITYDNDTEKALAHFLNLSS